MVSFLCDADFDFLRRLMKIFILGSTEDNKDTHLPLKQMRFPTAVKALIDKCECMGDPNNKLGKGCRLFLTVTIEKLQDRLPLKSAVGRYSSCLAPRNIINHKDLKFEKLVEKQ